MKRIIFGFAICVVASVYAVAQDGKSDLNRQMDVYRQYEPTVSTATKINIAPVMIDTVELRPETDYRIDVHPMNSRFEMNPIAAAKVKINMLERQKQFYVKAMGGLPFQSVLDVYATSTASQTGYVGAYLNHYGSWSKIKNDYGVKAPATQTTNRVGVLGERRFGRYIVEGDVNYKYDQVSNYGYFSDTALPATFDTTAQGLRQNYSTVGGEVRFGNSFKDLSYLNFRVGLDGSYFMNRNDYGEYLVGGFADLGQRFGDKHDVTLGLAYNHVGGVNKYEYKDDLFTISPMYRVEVGKVNLGVGFDFHNTKSLSHSSENYFLPRFELKLNIDRAFVPFIDIFGEMRHGSYRELVELNPYIQDGLSGHCAPSYHGRAGIMGGVGSHVSYKAFAGVSSEKLMPMFFNISSAGYYYGNTFALLSSDVVYFTAGGDVEVRTGGAFSATGSLQYRGIIDVAGVDEPIGIPKFAGSLGVKYRHGDKFTIGAGIDYVGINNFAELNSSLIDMNVDLVDEIVLVKQKSTVDLRLDAEVKLLDNLDLVASGRNLLGTKQYPYNHYAGLGAYVMVGVRFVF